MRNRPSDRRRPEPARPLRTALPRMATAACRPPAASLSALGACSGSTLSTRRVPYHAHAGQHRAHHHPCLGHRGCQSTCLSRSLPKRHAVPRSCSEPRWLRASSLKRFFDHRIDVVQPRQGRSRLAIPTCPCTTGCPRRVSGRVAEERRVDHIAASKKPPVGLPAAIQPRQPSRSRRLSRVPRALRGHSPPGHACLPSRVSRSRARRASTTGSPRGAASPAARRGPPLVVRGDQHREAHASLGVGPGRTDHPQRQHGLDPTSPRAPRERGQQHGTSCIRRPLRRGAAAGRFACRPAPCRWP